MPTLIELFQQRTVTSGPNTGKTMQEATAAQNSKIVDIQTTNPRLQTFANKINKRRKEQGIIEKENRLEEESVGLKALSDTSKLILYGGDYFRIINKTTRSKQIMLRNTGAKNAGLDDRIADKVGSAVGNFVGDRISNALQKKEDRVDPPPKMDFRSLGMDIGADVVSSTLGLLLPEPMIPSKVAKEYEKGQSKGSENFVHEYDIDKRNIVLNSRKKVPKFVDGILKGNKDILSQTKDVLISTAAGIAGGLVSSGIKGLSNLIFNKSKNAKGGKLQTSQPTEYKRFKYSSSSPYTAIRANKVSLTKASAWDRTDLSNQLVWNRWTMYNIINGTPEAVVDDPTPDIKALLESGPDKHSAKEGFIKTNLYKKRGMTSGVDALNIMNAIVYDGHTATIDAENNTADGYDFIPLKFYSVYKNETLQFRCTISDLTETFTPTWETNKFIGSPYNFYTYQSIERSVSFSFKVFSMNLMEHQFNWERINELASYTYPQDFKGVSGAVVPPILKFTLGNMYMKQECFIENLTFSIDENTPWEIGLNNKLTSAIAPRLFGGFTYSIDEYNSSEGYKLPMIINVEVGLKFIEGRNNSAPNNILYGYELPSTVRPMDKASIENADADINRQFAGQNSTIG